MARVQRALLSVSDKAGLVPFAERLVARGVDLVSTGGTARVLRDAGLPVTPVEALTGFPEMMDGRVKTLHPVVHGGIMARRDHPRDVAALEAHGIGPIDLVVVNLYPFEATVARAGVTLAEAIEQIDIGGPTMVRSAAKNQAFVGIVTDPADYDRVAAALDAHDGELPAALRAELAAAAFYHTAAYDAAIAAYLGAERDAERDAPPAVWGGPVRRVASLRYGENPHQQAGLYAAGAFAGLLLAEQVQGKPLSYNNWIDLDAAFQVARDLGPTGVAIIKHTNPCGAAVAPEGLVAAYRAARACDPTSAFGGIVATAGTLDAALAGELTETFLEVIVAAGASDEARALLARKKNLRLLLVPAAVWVERPAAWIPRPVTGGLLVQAPDLAPDDVRSAEVVTQRAPTEEEWRALALAWTVVRHVKSNGIVFARADRTVGIGAGQMSRVDSSRIAVMKAQSSLVGSSLASDAFFPFADGVEAAAAAGATAIVQPGGSIRDPEVIAAADAAGLAMVFTGRRHFRH